MSGWRDRARPTALARDLERAHAHAVGAASAGLQDAALGPIRLSGSAVQVLAEAAVTSATAFVRAPLLGRLSEVRRLHPAAGVDGSCPSCGCSSPCATAQAVSA